MASDVPALLVGHLAHQAVLGDGQEGRNALTIEELQQLVHVENERILLRHCRLISIQAVDHHRPDVGILGGGAHIVGEFAR